MNSPWSASNYQTKRNQARSSKFTNIKQKKAIRVQSKQYTIRVSISFIAHNNSFVISNDDICK